MTPLVIRMAPQLGASLIIIIPTTREVLFMPLELSIMLLENIIVQASLMMIIIYDSHILIVEATSVSVVKLFSSSNGLRINISE